MTSTMTLNNLRVGQKAVITKLNPALANRSRYASMGLIRNSILEVVRIAPLGDPMVIKILGYELSLRKNEASFIEIVNSN